MPNSAALLSLFQKKNIFPHFSNYPLLSAKNSSIDAPFTSKKFKSHSVDRRLLLFSILAFNLKLVLGLLVLLYFINYILHTSSLYLLHLFLTLPNPFSRSPKINFFFSSRVSFFHPISLFSFLFLFMARSFFSSSNHLSFFGTLPIPTSCSVLSSLSSLYL